MQNRHNNSAESFQLLQLSDDSKSLSDLELPEVVFQRKRKVRRKTRPKPNNRYNNQETDEYIKLNCKYVSIWMCVTLSCAWLFTLSYMLAIVHSEYHELNRDMKKLSAICLSMPETLQKLHESSKTLEQNQTAISQKMYEVQQRIETVEKEFSQLKDSIRQKGNGPDGEKAVDLKDTVAGFGAKIQSLETDVKVLKEGYSSIQSTQLSDKTRLDTLQSSLDSISHSTHSNFSIGMQNETSAWMKNLTEHCSNGLKNVSDQLTAMNDTFIQKIKSIDDEMHDHQTKLDGLNENFANVSSHVNSIESEWPKFKQLDTTVNRVNNDVINLKLNVGSLNVTLRNLLAQQQGIKKATNAAQDSRVNSAVLSDSQSLLNGFQVNPSESKVTGFPLEISNGGDLTNSTKTQPITPQPSISNAQSSSSSSASSTTSAALH